jgi:hypothetical protein
LLNQSDHWCWSCRVESIDWRSPPAADCCGAGRDSS